MSGRRSIGHYAASHLIEGISMLAVFLLCALASLSFAAGYGLRAYLSHRRRQRWLQNHYHSN